MKKYGQIKVQLNSITVNDSRVNIARNTRAYTLINSGASNCILDFNGNLFTLLPTTSITFGGYDDSIRTDDINVTFTGGTGRLDIMQDIIIEKPNFID